MLRKFREALRQLRKECPTVWPVAVRRRRLPPGEFGTVVLLEEPPHFRIAISDTLPYQFQLWVLVHEWAHALAWHTEDHPHVEDHGPEFGLAYAKAYQVVFAS